MSYYDDRGDDDDRYNEDAAEDQPDEGDGGPRCSDPRGHKFIVSDENEEHCYCERCGCLEY